MYWCQILTMTSGTVRSFRCGSRGLSLYAVCRTSFLSYRLKKTCNQNNKQKWKRTKVIVFFNTLVLMKDTEEHPCVTPQDSSYPGLRDLFVACCKGYQRHHSLVLGGKSRSAAHPPPPIHFVSESALSWRWHSLCQDSQSQSLSLEYCSQTRFL